MNDAGRWTFTGNAFFVDGGTIGRTGTGDLHIEGAGEASQTITGLSPNTTYTFFGYGAISTGSTTGTIGARSFGGNTVTSPVGTTLGTWSPSAVTFTTGASSTSAVIFVSNAGSNNVFF